MNKHIIDDARRCLQCPKPKCSEGCPLHTPIKDAIRLLLDGKIEQAGKMLFDNNPLSIVCSHVCPQENQCEGHCVMNKTGMPVNISEIEKYISGFYLSTCSRKRSDNWAGKIGIVGSGPAGMTIAFLLLQLNYSVTIYEGNDYAGGVMRYGIPEFRLPKKNLDELTKMLVDMGAVIRPNTTIGTNLTVDDLFRDGFDAIFIGTGVWKPQRLDIKGESLGNVHYAIDYLRNPSAYNLGDSLTVIGSGNTAMDVARTAIRNGCRNVTVACNWDENAMTARKVEYDYAKIDGVNFIYKKSIVEFTENGAVFKDSVKSGDDILTVAETEELLPSDSVIIAIGQAPRAVIVSSTSGIDINGKGLLNVDDCGRTTRKGVFASGDVVTGAKTVVEAVRVSKKVAEAIDEFVKIGKWDE